MRKASLAIGTAALVTLALTGCAAEQVPTPAPTPTYQCTPEAGGTPFRCDQRGYEDMVARDARYAEAEDLYRRLSRERIDLYRNGTEPGDSVTGLVMGAALDQLRRVSCVRDRVAFRGLNQTTLWGSG